MLSLPRYGKVVHVLSGLAMFFCFNLMQGCYYYKISTSKTSPDQVLITSQIQGKYIILHHNNLMKHLSSLSIENDTNIATASDIIGHTKYRDSELLDVYTTRYKKNKHLDESEVTNEVHVFVSKYNLIGPEQISIPIKNIEKIDIYSQAKGRTTVSFIGGIWGCTFLSFMVLGAIVVSIVWNVFNGFLPTNYKIKSYEII